MSNPRPIRLRSVRPAPPGSKHKKVATFEYADGTTKRVQFGARGYEDYTTHRDDARKKRYLDRHRRNEDWKDPTSAGALSRWILWNKKTQKESIDDFRRRFRLR